MAGATEQPAGPSNLTPTLFKRLFPRPYLERFLAESIRPDGRPAGEQAPQADVWRDASANIGSVSTAPSSALVRLGKTSVVCGVTLEIAPPDLARPHEGFIVPNVDLSPLCSPLFRPGPPADEAQVLSSRLRDILISSTVLPLSSLVIEPGKAAWVVYIDVVCLNYDGGVLDAAVLAAVGALKNLVFPVAAFDVDENQAICERVSTEHPGTRIPAASEPYSVSFGIFQGQVLPDPTLFESQLCSTELTVVLGAPASGASASKAPLINVYQAGAPLDNPRETLKACIAMARRRADELRKIVA
ncbi:exosome complex component RRP43 [Rhodotorula paludigena]|uniref:exosome complex component RRP43 n=1 Tax=Rhodotorula paludigena TaxID=86838 RepID=UPI003179F5BC